MQILGMTCDSASNNDAMIRELEMLTPTFAGFASHTCCFLHVVNLIAKSLIRQFDAKTMIEGNAELTEWAKGLAEEQDEFQKGDGDNANNDDNDKEADCADKDEDGMVDAMADLTEAEKDELERSKRPVKLVLLKVS